MPIDETHKKTVNSPQFLKRINGADEAAFSLVYETYAEAIWRHAYVRVSSREIAEDIASQTFLKAWDYIRKRKRPIDNIQSFLYRICNNLVIDFYRARAKDALPMNVEIENTIRSKKDTGETVQVVLELEFIRGAIDRLKEPYRQVLVWRYMDELEIGEISNLSGRNASNVSVILHRGLKKLHVLLDENEIYG